MIEISPNEKYLITYSKEDSSIVGWNVEDMDKIQLKFDQTFKINENNEDNEDNENNEDENNEDNEDNENENNEDNEDNEDENNEDNEDNENENNEDNEDNEDENNEDNEDNENENNEDNEDNEDENNEDNEDNENENNEDNEDNEDENNEENEDSKYVIKCLCVSDDKKLAYIDFNETIIVIDMNNKDKKVALNFEKDYAEYCTFNLKGEFILYSYRNIILIYSTQIKNNKWECKRFYKRPKDYKLITISKYDKVYLTSNDYIYEWNINTERSVKIFDNNKDKNKFETKNIGIFSNEKFIFLKINDRIIVYSIELEIPIASLGINDDIQLYNFMNHTGLFVFPFLFYYTPDKEIKYCWNNKYKNKRNKTLLDKPIDEPIDKPIDKPTDESTDDQTKFVFGILNRSVWKSKMSISSENSDGLNKENNKIIECDEKTYKHLNVYSFNLYMDTVSTFFQEAKTNDNEKDDYDESIELTGNLIKWRVCTYDSKKINSEKIKLEVFKKISTRWESISTRIENYPYYYSSLVTSSLFNNDDIVILTSFGILIYTFSENNKFSEKDKSIFLNYFYFMELEDNILSEYSNKIYVEIRQHYEKIFSKSTLPLPNHDSFRLDGWVSDVMNNKLDLLKYGGELLKFAIKEHKLELIDDIYKKCMTYFKEDLMNNKSFLSIITSTMSLLDEYYPEYILKYSSETNMIIDSSFYSIEHQNKNFHLHSFFQSPQIANLSKSILWSKYQHKFNYAMLNRHHGLKDFRVLLFLIIWVIKSLIIFLIIPLYFATCYILFKYNFINDVYTTIDAFSHPYSYIGDFISKFFKKYFIKMTPTITFIIPYFNFVNYSKDYNWFIEIIRPQPSPFTVITNRNIYKTWNGEALINFKWNTYGKYYYAMIWILFMALLGCFTTAATIPQQYINEEVRQQLFIASIILGFIHLILEIRQFLYNITKWFCNFWNIFDIIAYVLSIYTSIYWLQTNNKTNNKAFEYFGVYFAIIVSVGKKIISFLLVLFIIIISFAHAFYILLSPKSEISLEQYNTNNNDDPNNPWNLAPSYGHIDNNGNINSNPLMIQIPDKNTNMFIDIKTSLFAIYLFLIGDSSALSNWPYTENPSIAVIIVLFSLLVVVYLMNLLIGLLNIAIVEDNNRVSYLMQKAEILAEIELFYLLPNQRRWQTWFPEVIHYYADVDKTRVEIKRLIKEGEWDTKEFIEMRKNLFKVLRIENNSVNNEVLEKLKSYDEKLDKLEELEKLLKEIRAK
ncbi:hypothetical protein C1646_757826 [Rhizophagus diaphanus]|nr:hypothetical protein C1646_757826 [Rhizophagus diaphanus] [Rhizophagus sp. MUCL 43196]